MDEDGCLYVVDRKKDVFKSRKNDVNPSEVEDLILSIEGVAQVAVIGIPDPEFQSSPKAVVVKKEGHESLSEHVIVDFVAQRLAFHKHLHAGVAFVDSLPMTLSGKVKKRELIKQFADNFDV